MKFMKSYETLDFTDDFLFCKILTSDLSLTRELLEIILNEEIREVKVAEPQKSLKFTPYDRGVRFDVYVKDKDNVVYDVEMQTTEEVDLGKRARYYQGMIDLNLIESGMKFSDLSKSFVIFILKHRPREFPANLPIYTFRYRCDENPEVELHDEAVKVLVNAEGPTEKLSSRLRNFLEFIRDRTPRDEFTKKVDGQVKKARESKDWRVEYMTLEMKLQQYYDSGLKVGYDRCRQEMYESIISSALANHMTPSEIVEKLGIPEEVVTAILAEKAKKTT